jgi:ATP-dependent Lon protease
MAKKNIDKIVEPPEKVTGVIKKIPKTVPLLPLRDVVVFPDMIIPLMVAREPSVEALQAALIQEKLLFLALQKDPAVDVPEEKDIFHIGVIARVLQVLKLPNGTAKVLVEGVTRARIVKIVDIDTYKQVKIEEFKRGEENTPRIKALIRNVVSSFTMYVKLSKTIPDEVLVNIPNIDDPQQMTDTIAAHLLIRNTAKQEILETPSLEAELVKLASILSEEIEILELEKSIDNEVRERLQKSQKDFYLHEQMRVIKEELGEDDEADSEILELNRRIKKSGMSAEAMKKSREELKKLRRMHMMSPESTVVRNYLDWLLALPWKKRTRDNLDIAAARKILDEDHYGLQKAKERILEYLAVLKLAKRIRGPVLCFTGPPGTGKTSLAKSVARALNREFIRVSLGGIRDEAEIRGHRRTYIGALPGRIIQSMKKAGTRNPVFLLDEVDKLGTDFRGDPSSALLEVLDPEQNNAFSDHFLEVEYDLSDVMFITTANYEDAIPPPLLDRMELIRLSGYLEYEKVGIAERHLIPRQREANGLKPRDLEFNDASLLRLINNYTAEAGVRELERTLAAVSRKIARELVDGKKQRKRKPLTPRDLSRYLGVARYRDRRIERNNQVGVATGLAWTPVGGDILRIETSLMPGKGELILTGHLGDVMKESARAAVTYAKSNMVALRIPEGAFDKRDIHIHVPEGAIKKDGPSAGVSILTSLVSAVSGRPVSRSVGMTGEITLRGNVLAIGGLKEKALAASRNGLKKIVIPKENEPDLRDLPKEIRDRLTFVLADSIDVVLDTALAK